MIRDHWIKRLVTNLPLIFLIYGFSLVLASGLLMLAEGFTLGDSGWLAVVTALTIGYGDLSPKTLTGRIIVVVFGHLWIMGMVPLVIANIILRVIPDPHEFTHAEQEEMKANQRAMRDHLRELLSRVKQQSHTEYKVNGMKIDPSHPEYDNVVNLFREADPLFKEAQSLLDRAMQMLRRAL